MRKRRILVVDDSMTSREIFSDELAELGYEAIGVASAEEALESPSFDRFDAYLLDIRMPGMSGFELLHQIKERRRHAIVVLITQFEFARPDRVLFGYENVWFIRKPGDIYTLATILKNAFEADDVRRDVARLRSLAVGIKSVGQVRDLDQEFKVLLHLALDSLAADAGAIFLEPEPAVDGEPLGPRRSAPTPVSVPGLRDSDDAAEMVLQVGAGLPEGVAPGTRVPIAGTLRRCVDRQEPILVGNARVSRVGELAKLFPGVRRLHLLAVPLTAGHKLIGVLELYRDAERPSFDERDAVMAKLYAATAAVALENLRLGEAAQVAYRSKIEAQRELIQSRKLSSLGQVTAGISHEIRNPLTVILGNVELIRKRAQLPELDGYLDRIRGQCDRVLRLMDDLKAVYHPGDASRGRFRLRDLVDEALALAPPPPPRPGGTAVQTEVRFPEGQDAIVGDFSQLLHVLINLLSNAYQALEASGGTVWIEYSEDEHDQILAVRDDGPGIPDKVRSEIFQPFFTTKGDKGTGLGLWISDTILRSHGGVLELTEPEERGTCFHLRFPREQPESSRPPVPEEVVSPLDGEVDPLARVLIVDDEEDIRAYLGELLTSEGYRVEGAAGVKEAELRLEEGEFDMVLLDGKMPGSRGADFYARVIKPRYGLPAVYFTGSDDAPIPELMRLGFSAVIRKPCRGARILEAVRRALLQHVRPVEKRA